MYVKGFVNDQKAKLAKFNGKDVYYIDNIPCIFQSIKGVLAKVDVINDNLSMTSAFVYKHNSVFAHGETAKKARADAINKFMKQMSVEDRIAEFSRTFNRSQKYKASLFYDWHSVLTGSCDFGKDQFMKNHNISLNDLYTVDEFIKLTMSEYGGEIIKRLAE